MNQKINNLINITLNCIFYALLCSVFIIGIYLRLKLYLEALPFWNDEMFSSINFIDASYFDMFKTFYGIQKIPPLFGICTMAFVKIFGFKVLVFRLIPFISGILSLFFFYILLKNTFNNKLTILLGLTLLSLSSQFIYFSSEFKPYSSDALICILLLIAFKHISLKNMTVKKVILYTLCTSILVLFSLPVIFIISGMIITKYIEEKEIDYKSFFIFLGIIIPALFLWLTDLDTFSVMPNFYVGYQNEFVQFSFKSFYTLFDKFINYYTLENGGYTYSKYLLIIFFLSFMVFAKRNNIYAILFIITLLILINFKIYPLCGRLLMWTMPAFIMILISITDIRIMRFNKITNYTFTAVIWLLFSSSIFFLLMYNKIPGINITIDYPAEVRKPLSSRWECESYSIYILDNVKENQKILSTEEFADYLLLYSKIYNKVKNYNIERKLDITDKDKLNVIINDFIDKNVNEKEYYIIGDSGRLKADFRIFLTDLLNKRGLKFVEMQGKGYFFFKIFSSGQ